VEDVSYDGVTAAAERRVGNGRVIVFGTSLDDSWSDLALKPVYLPLVHQLTKYLARYEPPASWQTVGQVVDLSVLLKGRAERVVVSPSAERVTVPASEPGLVELSEQGVYEIRPAGSSSAVRPDRIAVNLDPTESDLAAIDPPELVAAVTGRASDAATQAAAADAGQSGAEDADGAPARHLPGRPGALPEPEVGDQRRERAVVARLRGPSLDRQAGERSNG